MWSLHPYDLGFPVLLKYKLHWLTTVWRRYDAYERAEYLRKILNNQSTEDGPVNNEHYQFLRRYFLAREDTKEKIPKWVRINRDLSEFWQFIKHEFKTYDERRVFIRNKFNDLLEYLEFAQVIPHMEFDDEKLKILNSEDILLTWKKAIQRKDTDPDGAITISRTLMESVLKHILEEMKISYSKDLAEIIVISMVNGYFLG